jgi:hypothetical protein
MKAQHRAEIERIRKATEKATVSRMQRTAVNCGQSSSCSVAGWFMDGINKRELQEKQESEDQDDN